MFWFVMFALTPPEVLFASLFNKLFCFALIMVFRVSQ